MEKKLLLVIDSISNPHAGTEGQFLLLINQLIQSDFEIRVLVLASSKWLQENTLPCAVDVLGSSSLKSFSTWWRAYQFARNLRAEGYKLAHIFFNDASVVCPPMFYLAGVKTIISRRDMGFWYNRLYRFLLPLTGKFVSCAVSNSQAVSAITAEVEKITTARLSVIYNGYQPKLASGKIIPQLENLKSQQAQIFGLVANIRPIKRMQDAIEAIALLDRQTYNPHLVILGAGDASDLQQLAATRGVSERVHFLGGRDDVHECLHYFVAGLLCSESEGFSNAIVEYQFAGLPVICTHTGGNPEAVNETLGWLYPVADVERLTECMSALLVDLPAAKTMGNRAKLLAEQRYTVVSMRDAYIALYHRLSGQ